MSALRIALLALLASGRVVAQVSSVGREAVDTSRPVIPQLGSAATMGDTSKLVSASANGDDETAIYFRTLLKVTFRPTATGVEIRGVLAQIGGEVVGGFEWDSTYVIRIPDPGATYADYEAFSERLRAQSVVARVAPYYYVPIVVPLGR